VKKQVYVYGSGADYVASRAAILEAKQRRRLLTYRERHAEWARAGNRNRTMRMTDGYVSKLLGFRRIVDVHPAIIEVKREQLRLLRLVREMTAGNTGVEK
jgi:hypothetical protein